MNFSEIFRAQSRLHQGDSCDFWRRVFVTQSILIYVTPLTSTNRIFRHFFKPSLIPIPFVTLS